MSNVTEPPSRQDITESIQKWNEKHLDLFNITQPDENSEFSGVIRFYFQEPGEKCSTKCLKISSTTTVQEIITDLVEKFHLNEKFNQLLTYSCWEVYENGEEHPLRITDCPLIVQLKWASKKAKEGRFLLKQGNQFGQIKETASLARGFLKNRKEKSREVRKKCEADTLDKTTRPTSIYLEIPNNSFARTLSNPEIVSKKRKEMANDKNPSVDKERKGALKDLSANYCYQTDENGERETVFSANAQERTPHLCPHVSPYMSRRELLFSDASASAASQTESMQFIDAENCFYLIPLQTGVQTIGLTPGIVTIGSSNECNIKLNSPLISPVHCSLLIRENETFLTPINNAFVTIDAMKVFAGTQLYDGAILSIGAFSFRFSKNAIDSFQHQTIHQNAEGSSKLSTPNFERRSTTPQVEYYSVASSANIDEQRMGREGGTPGSIQKSTESPYVSCSRMPPQPVEIPLPALVDCPEQAHEEIIIQELFNPASSPERFGAFTLTPSFMLYMICRHRLSPLFCPTIPANSEHRREFIRSFVAKLADFIAEVISTVSPGTPEIEVILFYLSNLSEFLFMVQSDSRIYHVLICIRIPERIGTLVIRFFDVLVERCSSLLQSFIYQLLFVGESKEDVSEADLLATRPLLDFLTNLVKITRRFHLNPALTIQLFSQMFRSISASVFNWIVATNKGKHHIRRSFGLSLKYRIELIQQWSEQQGLEVAVECQLDRVHQLVKLLVTPKTFDQLAILGSTCYTLNSIQMRYLLENYIIEENEPMLAIELIDQLVSLARAHADTMIVQDGFQLRLDDSPNLNMPFVLPRDGFIVESLRGIPPDMTSYMDALQLKGEIRVLLPSSSRQNPMQIWTGHMSSRTSIDPQIHGTPQCLPSPSMQRHASLSSKRTNGSTNRSLFPSGERGIDVIGLNSSQQPSIMQITLKRPPGKGIGLSIVEIVGQRIQSGIYIKKVIEGSAAFQDGQFDVGDQILKVNGNSLSGVNQEMAATILKSAGSNICIEIDKRSVYLKGLSNLLHQNPSSPTTSMASTLVATDSLCNLQHICPQDYKQLSNHFNINQGFGPNMNGNNTNSLGHRPPEYQHQHNTSSQLFRLPPHYRPASNRYPVVMATTPDNHHQMNPVSYSPNANAVYHNLRVRPLGTSTAPVSPSTLSQGYNHNRQFSDQQICHGLSVTRLGSCPQTPQQDQRWPNIVSDGNYAYLPFSSDIPGGDASPPPNTSTNSTATNEDDHFGNSQFKNSFKKNYDNLNEVLPNKVNDPSTSGRRSAPIFGQNTAIVETKVPQAMTIDQMYAEIGRLSSLGRPLTEPEEQRHRFLIQHLSLMKDFQDKNTLASKPKPTGRHVIPYFNEIESRLKAAKTGQSILSSQYKRSNSSANENGLENMESLIQRLDEVAIDSNPVQLKSEPCNEPTNNVTPTRDSKKSPPPVPAKPARRDISKASIATEQDFDGTNEMEELVLNLKDDDAGPRVQIMGANEVYANDPRQRRLDEFQITQKTLKPVDGSNLGFREKMKLFASSRLVENTHQNQNNHQQSNPQEYAEKPGGRNQQEKM